MDPTIPVATQPVAASSDGADAGAPSPSIGHRPGGARRPPLSEAADRAVGGSERELTDTAPGIALPGPLEAQIEGLVAKVESLRELDFKEPPVIVALSPEDVVARRAASLEESFAHVDFAPEEALYRLFGIFDEPVDLEDFYTEFYSASTLAFYDLEEHELVIPISGELLTPYEQWIMVHELAHALLDQQYPEVTERYRTLGDTRQFEIAGGLLGLIEGEAVLVQSLFYETLDSEERADLQRQANQRRNATFANAPSFFRSVSRFPYTDGSLFVLYLYQRGGMDAINRAYEDPPVTTEEIYEPEAFVEGIAPLDPALQLRAPFGFEIVERGTWGARGWRSLFGQFLNGGTAAAAARGWGGDSYALLWNPETHQVAFVSVFVGDTQQDASEFGGAVQDFVASAMNVDLHFEQLRTSRYVGSDYAEVQRINDRALFIAASDEATGTAVRAGVRGFGQ